MRPSDKLLKLYRILRMCAAACGTDIIDEAYKFNKITTMVIVCITVYFIFTVYTIQLKFSENWTVALEATCMVGSVFQGISKLTSAIIYKDGFRHQARFLSAIYSEYEKKSEDYRTILNSSIVRMYQILKFIGGLYLVALLILVTVPVVMVLLTDQRLFIMQFFMPGVDTDTYLGYILTNGMQLTCLIFGAFGNFAGDMFMLVLFTHSPMLVEIFALKVKELNELVKDTENQRSLANKKLLEVIKFHQIYNSFIEKSDSIYFWITFTEIATSGLAIVFTMAVIFVGDWPGAYAYILLSFVMLYLYCGMGTVVEIANSRVTDEIYQIHWYKLTASQQKIVRLMLMQSQSSMQITVGGVLPLSVATGLQVTKTVYSIFMMFLQFF